MIADEAVLRRHIAAHPHLSQVNINPEDPCLEHPSLANLNQTNPYLAKLFLGS